MQFKHKTEANKLINEQRTARTELWIVNDDA